MSLQTISILKTVLFFFTFLFPGYVCVPRAVQSWEEWKKTRKPMLLSHAVTFFMLAVFMYISALIMGIFKMLGYYE